jgi:hypothetical protein
MKHLDRTKQDKEDKVVDYRALMHKAFMENIRAEKQASQDNLQKVLRDADAKLEAVKDELVVECNNENFAALKQIMSSQNNERIEQGSITDRIDKIKKSLNL